MKARAWPLLTLVGYLTGRALGHAITWVARWLDPAETDFGGDDPC